MEKLNEGHTSVEILNTEQTMRYYLNLIYLVYLYHK